MAEIEFILCLKTYERFTIPLFMLTVCFSPLMSKVTFPYLTRLPYSSFTMADMSPSSKSTVRFKNVFIGFKTVNALMHATCDT